MSMSYEVLIGEHSPWGPYDVRVICLSNGRNRVVEHYRRVFKLADAKKLAAEKSKKYGNAPIYG